MIAVVLILVCTLYSTNPSLFQYFASVNTGIRTVDPGCLCHWSPCWCWDTTFSVFMVAQSIHKACRWHKMDQYNRKNGSMRLKLINVFLTNEVISLLAPLQQINLHFPRNQDKTETWREMLHCALWSQYSVCLFKKKQTVKTKQLYFDHFLIRLTIEQMHNEFMELQQLPHC